MQVITRMISNPSRHHDRSHRTKHSQDNGSLCIISKNHRRHSGTGRLHICKDSQNYIDVLWLVGGSMCVDGDPL